MTVRLVQHEYGEARVRLLKVRRRAAVHDIRDITVQVRLQGEFDATYTKGDNSKVLPTDTMKNTVYALARQHAVDRLESFGVALAHHFLSAKLPTSGVTVELEEQPWTRIMVAGRHGRQPHPHSFVRSGIERWCARVTDDRKGAVVESGIEGLRVLRSAGAGFEGFPRDPFTTLEETRDWILATEVSARWRWAEEPPDYAASSYAARDAMLETFATEHSPSVQYTLHAMGKAALERVPQIGEIRIALPDLQCVRVDLSPFGLDNPNEVFMPTEEPHGVVEATLARK